MPAKYFDVYIRQAATRFTESTTILTANILSGWDKIGIAPEKSVVRADPITTPVGDGSAICEGFNLVVETGEKSVANWWYDNLRLNFHNQLCDFMFIDHEQDEFVMAVFGVKCHIYQTAVSGESMTIAITAAAQKAADVALTSCLVLSDKMSPSCLVEVECWAADHSYGVASCIVQLELSSPSRTYTAISDGNGIARFLVETPSSPTTAIATATVTNAPVAYQDVWTWQSGKQVTIARYGKYFVRVEGYIT